MDMTALRSCFVPLRLERYAPTVALATSRSVFGTEHVDSIV